MTKEIIKQDVEDHLNLRETEKMYRELNRREKIEKYRK